MWPYLFVFRVLSLGVVFGVLFPIVSECLVVVFRVLFPIALECLGVVFRVLALECCIAVLSQDSCLTLCFSSLCRDILAEWVVGRGKRGRWLNWRRHSDLLGLLSSWYGHPPLQGYSMVEVIVSVFAFGLLAFRSLALFHAVGVLWFVFFFLSDFQFFFLFFGFIFGFRVFGF